MAGTEGQNNHDVQIALLRQSVQTLGDTFREHSAAIERTLDRIDKRMQRLEDRQSDQRTDSAVNRVRISGIAAGVSAITGGIVALAVRLFGGKQ